MCVCFIEPPSIQYAGETLNETILAGFQIQLECKATGSPLPGELSYNTCPLVLRAVFELASIICVVSPLMLILLQL